MIKALFVVFGLLSALQLWSCVYLYRLRNDYEEFDKLRDIVQGVISTFAIVVAAFGVHMS